MVTKDDDVIEVCSEETLNEILDRYMELNEHPHPNSHHKTIDISNRCVRKLRGVELSGVA